MGAGIMVTRGGTDPGAPQTVVFKGEVTDPLTKEKLKIRITTNFSPDAHEMAMFETRGDAPERQMLKIGFTKSEG
jgi:hypothetical protein